MVQLPQASSRQAWCLLLRCQGQRTDHILFYGNHRPAQSRKNNDDFYQTRYRLHVLPLIWPDPQLSVNENAKLMMEKDYAQKRLLMKGLSEKLDYRFTPHDIAGWRG